MAKKTSTTVAKAAPAHGPTASAGAASPAAAALGAPASTGITKLAVELEHCYGIRSLKAQFDFSQHPAYAIYAPNGAMKSSFAQTFSDIASDTLSKDRIFPSRVCKRLVTDQRGAAVAADAIVVVRPYDEEVGHTEKTSTLLVNSALRKEYETLHAGVDKAKDALLKALKKQSGSKKDLEAEISSTFTKSSDQFLIALGRVKDEIVAQKDAPFAEVPYDTIVDEKVLAFLGTKDFRTAIESYIRKYNELLDGSTYFKKGTFNYYNASTIAKSLAENGFFDARHTVSLNATEKLEITTPKQLEELIAKEKEGISKDPELRKKFSEIEKLITKNANVRDFEAYVTANEWLLPELTNIELLKERLWKSYLKAQSDLYKDLLDKHLAVQTRKKEIEAEAQKERTQWERVIAIFNSRFFVPFKLTAENKVSVMLGQDAMLSLGFTYDDGTDSTRVGKADLMQVLSTGEKKALYILNVIFEVEVRKRARQVTIFIVDDIADSFDYKNKYAIIQYLKDIAEEPHFKLIILTHNFDFFRTINSRFISYQACLMASKRSTGVTLEPATGIKNVFVNDWKGHFFDDAKKRIASIPFIRNLIEYTRGKSDVDYLKLTSLLHWKANSATITQGDLDAIYNSLFATKNKAWTNQGTAVVDMIEHEAKQCLVAAAGANFEHKIVLSIAIRLVAERFMVTKINDTTFVSGIDENQTAKLLTKYKTISGADRRAVEIIEQVILMTPENIHLNSFMYEPILDMSDDHLRQLFKDVQTLK